MIIGIAAILISVLLALALAALLARYFVPKARSMPYIGDKYKSSGACAFPVKEAVIFALIWFAISRAILAAFGVASALISSEAGRLDVFSWIKWDANHYVGLARNWYVNEGDARFHIVFFPLFPAILRAFHLMGMDERVVGIVLSNLFLIVAAAALYCLACVQYGPRRAMVAMRLFLFSPMTLFFSLPYSESLFIMLTLLCVCMAKKRKFGRAIFFAALASAARVLGLLTAVVIFYEFIGGRRGLKPRDYAKYALLTSLASLGFVAYLLLNLAITGDMFTFLTYQREHWSQSMGSVGNTVMYTLENCLDYYDENIRMGTWIPQAAAIFASVALLCLAFRRISPADGAYAILYIWFALSPTWLLSGARYISAMYPLYFMLSWPAEGRKREIAAIALSAGAMFYMTHMFLSGGVM